MSWRDRTSGHVLLDEADFTELASLPKPVAFQVREFQHKKRRKVWFIGTRSGIRKWKEADDPFGEFAPSGSPRFVRLVKETAAPFCQAFDEVYTFEKSAFRHSDQFAGYGPSQQVGELSLGLELATLLAQPVFSFIDDDDPAEARLACVCDPGRAVRARCEKAGFHLLFDGGVAEFCHLIFQDGILADPAAFPEGFPPPGVVDPSAVFHRLTRMPAVTRGDPPAGYRGWSQELVRQELNAFVGVEIAAPITVVPPFARMKLLAQRTAGGRMKLFSERD